MDAEITRIVDGIAASFGLRADLDLPAGVSATVNHRAEAELAAVAAASAGLTVRRHLPPAMAAEDFGSFLALRPGAFLWIGNGMTGELHAPDYDFNDAVLPAAATALAAIALSSLNK